jgi:hypothetical protein
MFCNVSSFDQYCGAGVGIGIARTSITYLHGLSRSRNFCLHFSLYKQNDKGRSQSRILFLSQSRSLSRIKMLWLRNTGFDPLMRGQKHVFGSRISIHMKRQSHKYLYTFLITWDALQNITVCTV